MKKLNRKKRITILFLIVAMLLSGLFIMLLYNRNEALNSYSSNNDELQTVGNTIEYLKDQFFDETDRELDDLVLSAELTASAIRTESGKDQPGVLGSGYIIRVTDDRSGLPKDFPGYDNWDSMKESFTDESGTVYDDVTTVVYANISDDLFYVQYTDYEFNTIAEGWDSLENSIEKLAEENGHDYMLLQYSNKEDLETLSTIPAVIATGEFKNCESLKDLGISPSQLIDALDNNTLLKAKYNGKTYLLQINSHERDQTDALVMFIDYNEMLLSSAEQIVLILYIMIVILAAVAILVLSAFRSYSGGDPGPDDGSHLSFENIKKKAIAILSAGAVMVFVSAAYADSVDEVFMQAERAESSLAGYFTMMDNDTFSNTLSWESSQSRYKKTAELTAALIDRYGELQNSEWLREAAEIIGADYITIYDNSGNEVVSGARYRGLSLGSDESSATYTFRRLLRGVRYISRTNVKDEITGLTRDLHGISLRFNSDENAYGAMLVAVDPDNRTVSSKDIEDVIDTVTYNEGGLCFGVDPETEKIIHSNDDNLLGTDFSEAASKSLSASFMGEININGSAYYASSARYNDYIYYYCIEKSALLNGTLNFAFMCLVCYLLMAAGLMIILLHGVSLPEASTDSPQDVYIKQTGSIKTGKGRHMLSIFNRNASPADRTLSFIELSVLFAVVSVFAMTLTDSGSSSPIYTTFRYIVGGSWEHKPGLFSMTAVLYAFCTVFVTIELAKALNNMVSSFLDEKGRTVSMLLYYIVKYALIIAFVLISLGYFGVNTRALFASAGLLGLTVSLGAQSTIKDMLAGLGIILGDTYHVGEVIEANGFRGEVLDVGLINTTLLGTGNNVKTFKNSSMADVTNYSRLSSWYDLQLTISSEKGIEEIEEIMHRELADIGAGHSSIISGPKYRGVQEIMGDRVRILILTECNQADMHKVKSIVNKGVLKICEKHGIKTFG